MAKLKNALLSHQAQAAKHAAKKKAEANREAIWSKSKGKGSAKSKAKSSQPAASTTNQAAAATTPKSKAGPKQRPPTIAFDKLDTILLLGEANFSFALPLITAHAHPAHQLLATSYDDEKTCYKKYPDASANVETLRAAGVKVGWGVDAGALGKSKCVGKGRRWSRVIFNFPHVGAGITDQDRNILSNQHLLLRTLQSVNAVLTTGPPVAPSSIPSSKARKRKRKPESDDEAEDPTTALGSFSDLGDDDLEGMELEQPVPSTFTPPNRQGSLLVTLLDQPPYSLWELAKLATRPPEMTPGTQLVQPRYRTIRSFEFRPETYPGYAHRRTLGFKVGVSRDGNEEIVGRKGTARTWEFVPRDVQE